MGLSIATSTNFENKDILKNAAKNILLKSGLQEGQTSQILEKNIFSSEEYNSYVNPQLSIIKASTQISVNNTLNETLKYLKSHPNNLNRKKHVFGELWNIASIHNNESEENPYRDELIDFKIDTNNKNIFAA